MALIDAEPRPKPRGGIISGSGSIAENVYLLKGGADHPGFGES